MGRFGSRRLQDKHCQEGMETARGNDGCKGKVLRHGVVKTRLGEAR